VNTSDAGPGGLAESVGRLLASVSTLVRSESDAKWIVAQASGIPPGELRTGSHAPLSKATVEAVHRMAQRRCEGEPLQYVLQEWSFRHLDVRLDRRALIPRPETEQVVEIALEELRGLSRMVGDNPADCLVVADLGTGSGVIALSIALEGTGAFVSPMPIRGQGPSGDADLEVWATDQSVAALDLARDNLARLAGTDALAASRVRLAEGSWFDALPQHLRSRVHLVVSNPPYVSATEWSVLDHEVRDYEPRVALVAGETGLEVLEMLLDQARRWLAPGGSLVLELAPHQASTLSGAAESKGYVDVGVRPDLAGRARSLVARWPGG
jgi:release factor glutamine methyltransferase